MNVYIFQAALLCEDCAKTKQTALDRIAAEHGNVNHHYRDDSDKYPQGPFGDGGGEADTPQHCDHCGTFLHNPLTGDGLIYVKTLAVEFCTAADDYWPEVADRADAGGKPALAEWIRFYL